ncbi:MAG TPA: hydrogenase expression/formation protein HypE [Gemmatimonadales bacterium]|nr:hydrogenase expression/formation protein HypE [Gemmatimonadales bacterium]
MTSLSLAAGLVCPVPAAPPERIQLGHGSGGKLSAALLRDRFLPHLANPILQQLGDAAVLPVFGGRVAMSTDTFVVNPVEFPGGNIGSLAVHGTLNDIAMMGATPRFLSAGFVIEEGLEFELLDRVIAAMAGAAREAGVPLVTGDTKVVERGKADRLYINTTGIGTLDGALRPAPDRAASGDAVLVSGPIGRHGLAIMAARENLGFDAEIESDSATLYPLVARLGDQLGAEVHVLRDPTRGGVASALNEIAAASRVGIVLDESAVPIPGPVAAACEMLGLDPLYVANEGVMLVILPEPHADSALALLRGHALGTDAVRLGRVVPDHPGMVIMRTAVGGSRVVDMLPGDQLPRIC